MSAIKVKRKEIVKKEEAKYDNEEWLEKLYDVDLFTHEEIIRMCYKYQYKAFDRNIILNKLKEKFTNNSKIVMEVILVCALRGPKKAATISLSNGKSCEEMGIFTTNVQDTNELSCNRIVVATADLAAYYLKSGNTEKRLDMECPAWLQFPSAGSIKLPPVLRTQHLEFSKRFSEVIGGVFSEQIYNNMIKNSYYNEKLNLF